MLLGSNGTGRPPANQYHGTAYSTTVHPPDDNWSSIQASRYGQQPSRTHNATPKLRGRTRDRRNSCPERLEGDHSPLDRSEFNLVQPMGTSPMVGFGDSAPPGAVWARGSPQDERASPRALKPSNSEPLYHNLPEGRTRDGNLLERHATDIHEGRPWRRAVPWAPSSDYDAEAARDNNNRSDLGTKEKASIKGWLEGASRQTTDIHDGKPWKRAVPWAPAENYGVGDPHPQPPHMRSEVDSVVYGRDIDGSGSGGEVPEWAVHVGAEETAAMGWSMKRSRSNIHREYKSEPAATSSLHKPVGQEQCKGRRMQQIVFGGETPGTEPRDPSCHYGKQGPDSQDGHGVPTSFKPPERTGGMAEVLRNPYLSAAYDTASATAHERGQSDILSAESNPFYRRHGKAVAFERHFAVPGSQARADAQPFPPPPPQAQAQAQPKPKPKPKPNPSPSPSPSPTQAQAQALAAPRSLMCPSDWSSRRSMHASRTLSSSGRGSLRRRRRSRRRALGRMRSSCGATRSSRATSSTSATRRPSP